MSEVFEMDTDLMSAPRLQSDVQEVGPEPALANLEPRRGLPSVLDDRHSFSILRITTDRGFDQQR